MTVRLDSRGARERAAVGARSTLRASVSTATLSPSATARPASTAAASPSAAALPAAAFTETNSSGSPVPDRPLGHLVRIGRLLQATPGSTEALEVPRAAREVTPEVDDAQVQDAELLGDVRVDLALGEDRKVFLLVDANDPVATPVQPVP